MAQKRVNEEYGGREVLLDIDILNLDLTLIGAGRRTLQWRIYMDKFWMSNFLSFHIILSKMGRINSDPLLILIFLTCDKFQVPQQPSEQLTHSSLS